MVRNLSLFVLTLPWFLVPATVHGQTNDNENYGLNRIADLMETNTEAFCKLVTCFDPLEKEECPDGTFFMEGIAQFGCCGACVQFRGIGEQCTGSIHPKYCGGYGLYNPVSGCKDPWQNLRDLRDSISDDFYSQDNVVTSSWCGYNIACGNSRVCEINPEERGCVYIQNKYDEARAEGPDIYLDYRDDYRWRPTCTTDGFFTEKQCKGPRGEQRCVCVDPDGNRLFGEAFYYQEELFNSMNCKCSRRAWELRQAGEASVTLHCTTNGNYEPLQCEDGWCYCMNPATGIPYGSRLPEGAMNRLDCYNKTLVGEQYLRRCESEYHAHMELYEVMARKGVQGPSTSLKCDEDGSYAGMQCSGNVCRCYDKYLNIIGGLTKTGCQCSRDIWMNDQLNIAAGISCEVDSGSYAEVQTRSTYAFCVDEDGVRAGPLVHETVAENLACGAARLCQEGEHINCDKVCIGCTRDDYVN